MWAGKAHSQSIDAVNALVPYAFWAVIRSCHLARSCDIGLVT
jgi:hypothetical protein